MIEITQEEHEEYLRLRSFYKQQIIRESMMSGTTLEADIDMPIKKCVAMLALLGCETIWSCCGFDYAGQPVHKSHQYGSCGVVMLDTPAALAIVRRIESSAEMPYQNRSNGWRYSRYTHYGDDCVSLTSNCEKGNTWPDKDSIHYSEPAAIAIGLLENFLLGMKSQFSNQAVIKDYNRVYRERYPHWQYQPKSDWVVRRCDVVND